MKLDFSVLNPESNILDFDCGIEELNAFLKDYAMIYQNRRFGATLVFFDKKDPQSTVIGFYTLAPAQIDRKLLPDKLISGPRPNPIPAFRLCRLAVDRRYQGKRIGEAILIHCFKKCIEESKQVGGSVVIVDAKNEQSRAFYERFGFTSLLSDPFCLVMSMKNIELNFLDS